MTLRACSSPELAVSHKNLPLLPSSCNASAASAGANTGEDKPDITSQGLAWTEKSKMENGGEPHEYTPIPPPPPNNIMNAIKVSGRCHSE